MEHDKDHSVAVPKTEDARVVNWGRSKYSDPPLKTLPINKDNKSIYLTATWFLGTTVLISVLIISYIAYLGKDSPSALVAIASIAAGALANLFTRDR